ncbi:MAG: hypothetical protein V1926_01215 [Candidatus Peregrinibacteria bacterium]
MISVRHAPGLFILLALTIAGCAQVPRAPTENEALQAITRSGQWFLRRADQKKFLRYEVDPKTGNDMPNNQELRKMGALWSIARLASFTGNQELSNLARKGLAFFDHFRTTDQSGGACFEVSEKKKLGYNAFMILTLLELNEPTNEGSETAELADGILRLQNRDGSYRTYFDDSGSGSEAYYPGEANLALASLFRKTDDPRYRGALDLSLPYYRSFWRGNRTLAFIPWHTQAFALLWEKDRKTEERDFIFEMNDWLVQQQNSDPSANGYGSFGNAPGISSASYLEGLIDAVRIAKLSGDTQREERYREAAKLGMRFILTLQVDNVSIPQANGGFRASADGTVRVDHTQHAVMALMKAISAEFLR